MSESPRRAPRDLEARIDELSAAQRAALVSRLAGLRGEGRHAPRSTGPALVAFVTVDGAWNGPAPTPTELRAHLQGLVPGQMIPSSIRLLDEMPRLPNGKIDVSALAALPRDAAEPETSWVPPRNDIESKLAAIWCEVLQVDEIGVHEPFFELGGDSILSIHVTSRANQLGLGLLPNDIFNFPTIAELATRCAAIRPNPNGAGGRRRTPLFMVQWGAREAALLRQHLDREQSLFCFAAHWHGAHLKRGATVEHMAAERLVELRSLQPSGPYFIGGYSMGVPIALEMARQLRREGELVPMLFVLDPPRRNPEEEAVQQGRPRTVPQKLAGQLRTLAELKPAEWVRYLGAEARAQVRHRLWEPLKMAWVAAARRVGLAVPEALWHHYVGTIYTRARNRYEHAPYDGDVVVFGAGDEAGAETLRSWRDLVRGHLHVETFEGSHLDFTMDLELFARWARRLNGLLADREDGAPGGLTDHSGPPDRPMDRQETAAPPGTASAAR